jgi:hypothetical protein
MGYKYLKYGTAAGQLPSVNATFCAEVCQAQTTYNQKHPNSDGTFQTCNQVVAYMLSDNNQPQGQYCAMYSHIWDASYATNYGQYRGSDRWSVSMAYAYNLQQ